MSCIMSFIISVFNVGFIKNILVIWLNAWSFAFLVAFPAMLMISPVVRYLVVRVLTDE